MTIATDRFSFNQIGPADAFGMLECYLRHTLKGDRYDDVRGYAKKTVKLVDHVTHIKCEDAIAMETAVTAVVALVALVNTVSRGA